MTAHIHFDFWNNNYITAGGVSQVGDSLTAVRLRRSCPEQAPTYSYKASRGSDTIDGNNQAMFRPSAGARVYERGFIAVEHPNTINTQPQLLDRLKMPLQKATDSAFEHNVRIIRAQPKAINKEAPKPFALPQNAIPRGMQQPRRYTITEQFSLDETYRERALGYPAVLNKRFLQ